MAKFNKGNRVTVVTTNDSDQRKYIGTQGTVVNPRLYCQQELRGSKGTVMEDGSECPYVRMDTDGRNLAFYESELELAKPLKFKVGDEVEVIQGRNHRGFEIGTKGTIGPIECDLGDQDYKVDNGTKTQWQSEDELRLIVKPKFAVGDKVTPVDCESLLSGQRRLLGNTMTVDAVMPKWFNEYTGYSLAEDDGYDWRESELALTPKFTKADLRTGMLVQLRKDNQWLVVVKDAGFSDGTDALQHLDDGGYMNLDDLSDNLVNTDGYGHGYDVVRVATVDSMCFLLKAVRDGDPVENIQDFKVIWERTEVSQ
jgi:hypothetical protein